MKHIYALTIILVQAIISFSQSIEKPIGCFAGTNGTNALVLAHSETRGVLLTEKWSDIEVRPGVYNFTNLNNKIITVKNYGLKYSLAIAAGAFGSPSWLIDSLNSSFHSFQYQNQNWRLPLWWDTTCAQKLNNLITQVGNQYSSDSMLSHVYVSQMTVNGIEGHLNGVNMTAFTANGFTDQKWISASKSTAIQFANAFPDKPIVFEIHEINHDTLVPSMIINDLYNDASLCNRIGLGMWWISGKTTYQTDLISFISNYQGDKYAQIIGRSDQTYRFKDSLYSNVFIQAKNLGIRYIEPWPYEFQFNTHDSLIQDFNSWADLNFVAASNCTVTSIASINVDLQPNIGVYPNPTNGLLQFKINQTYNNLVVSLFNSKGALIMESNSDSPINLSAFPRGIYFVQIKLDNYLSSKKILKL